MEEGRGAGLIFGKAGAPSTASNPGRITLKPLHYSQYYPEPMKRLLLGALFTTLGMVAVVATKGSSLLLLVFGIRWLMSGYKRLKGAARHFDTGCALPGIVVSTAPFTVASLTDLTTGDHATYNAVRIMPRPLKKVRGRSFTTGDRIPCVALYSGYMPAPKWDSFNPVPAIFATDDAAELARIEASIPEREWRELNEAMFQIPKPYRNGLFHVDLSGMQD